MRLQVSISLQDLRGCAESALYAPILDKSILDRVQAPRGGGEDLQAFYRQNVFPIRFTCSQSAGFYRFSIEQHGTNAALTFSAANFCTR